MPIFAVLKAKHGETTKVMDLLKMVCKQMSNDQGAQRAEDIECVVRGCGVAGQKSRDPERSFKAADDVV
jgi:hypothetical protein